MVDGVIRPYSELTPSALMPLWRPLLCDPKPSLTDLWGPPSFLPGQPHHALPPHPFSSRVPHQDALCPLSAHKCRLIL